MDMDFTFSEDHSTDQIENFLASKLNAIKAKKKELEKTLQLREKKFECVRRIGSNNYHQLEITETWKKIISKKYVIGIVIRNKGSLINEHSLILAWNGSSPLIYTTIIYNSTKRPPVTSMADLETILVVIPIPDFSKKQSYQIEGILCHDTEQIKIPEIILNNNDILDGRLSTNVHSSTKDCLCTIVANKECELKVWLPKSDLEDFEKSLEFDCRFRLVEVGSSKYSKIFSLETAGEIFKNMLLVLDKSGKNQRETMCLQVYYSNDEEFIWFLCYMYKSVDRILIIPGSYEETFLPKRNDTDLEVAKELEETMEKEANMVKKFFQAVYGEGRIVSDFHKAPKSFRLNLAELEDETDTAFQKFLMCSTGDEDACDMDVEF